MPEFSQNLAPQDLQFQRAELVTESPSDPNAQRCAVCKSEIGGTYFHAQGQVVCPMCAERIQSGQQAPPAISLGRAAIYGLGAALAGCLLYAAVAIILNLEIGIVAIAVGIMVGKAIRAGSNGLGGRPQQILAVVLTYFAITTSYIPVYFHERVNNPKAAQTSQQSGKEASAANPGNEQPQKMSVMGAIFMLLLIFAAAPFLGLGEGIGGLISLFIIFIGLQRAWNLTGRSDILVMGPYETKPAQ